MITATAIPAGDTLFPESFVGCGVLVGGGATGTTVAVDRIVLVLELEIEELDDVLVVDIEVDVDVAELVSEAVRASPIVMLPVLADL